MLCSSILVVVVLVITCNTFLLQMPPVDFFLVYFVIHSFHFHFKRNT